MYWIEQQPGQIGRRVEVQGKGQMEVSIDLPAWRQEDVIIGIGARADDNDLVLLEVFTARIDDILGVQLGESIRAGHDYASDEKGQGTLLPAGWVAVGWGLKASSDRISKLAIWAREWKNGELSTGVRIFIGDQYVSEDKVDRYNKDNDLEMFSPADKDHRVVLTGIGAGLSNGKIDRMYCRRHRLAVGANPQRSDGGDFKSDIRLLAEYAPLVRLGRDEAHYPSSIDWYCKHTDFEGKPIEPSFAEIIDPTLKAYEGKHIRLPYDDTARAGTSYDLSVYAYVAGDDDYYYLYYWLFYPLNGAHGPVVGAFPAQAVHEADWEHVVVRLSRKQKGAPPRVFLSAHSGGKWMDWSDLERYGSHPVVYAASESHANYPTADFIWRLGDTASHGFTWLTWCGVVDVGWSPHALENERKYAEWNPRNGQMWLKFSGRWGSSSGMTSSPRGPAYKSTWQNPIP